MMDKTPGSAAAPSEVVKPGADLPGRAYFCPCGKYIANFVSEKDQNYLITPHLIICHFVGKCDQCGRHIEFHGRSEVCTQTDRKGKR